MTLCEGFAAAGPGIESRPDLGHYDPKAIMTRGCAQDLSPLFATSSTRFAGACCLDVDSNAPVPTKLRQNGDVLTIQLPFSGFGRNQCIIFPAFKLKQCVG